MEVARTFLADNAAAPPQSFPVLGFFPKPTLKPTPKKNCTKSALSAFTTSNHFLETRPSILCVTQSRAFMPV